MVIAEYSLVTMWVSLKFIDEKYIAAWRFLPSRHLLMHVDIDRR